MSRKVVTVAMSEPAPIAAWYGKSPSIGDFVSRRLSKGIVDTLHSWFQSGMAAIRERAPDAWERHYAAAPVWNALLPAHVVSPKACIAVVAASFDRVGRRFPLCVLVELPEGNASLARITSLPDYCASLSRLVDQSIRAPVGADELDRRLSILAPEFFRGEDSQADDLSDIVAVLGDAARDSDLTTVPLSAEAAFPWPELAGTFDVAGTTSYWWSAVRPGRLQGGFTHRGALDASLFVMLFGDSRNDSEGREPAG
jgi:type VI secretion system protein ImpM